MSLLHGTLMVPCAMLQNIIVYILRSGHPVIILPWNVFHLLADVLLFFPADPPPPLLTSPVTTNSNPAAPSSILKWPTVKKDCSSLNQRAHHGNMSVQLPPGEGVPRVWPALLALFFVVLPLLSALHPPLVPFGGLALKIFVLPVTSKWALWAPAHQLASACPPFNHTSPGRDRVIDEDICALLRYLRQGGPRGRDLFHVAWEHFGLAPRGGLTLHHHVLYAKHLCRRVTSLHAGAGAGAGADYGHDGDASSAVEALRSTLTFSFYTAAHRLGGREVWTLDCPGLLGASTTAPPAEHVTDIWSSQRTVRLAVHNERSAAARVHTAISHGGHLVEFRNDLSSPVQLLWHAAGSNFSGPGKLQAVLQPGETHFRTAARQGTRWSYQLPPPPDASEGGGSSPPQVVRRFETDFPALYVEVAGGRAGGREVSWGGKGAVMVAGGARRVVREVITGTVVFVVTGTGGDDNEGTHAGAVGVFVPHCPSGCARLHLPPSHSCAPNDEDEFTVDRNESVQSASTKNGVKITCSDTCTDNWE